MLTLSQSRWSLRAITLAVWALAAASLGYWGLGLSRSSEPPTFAQQAAAPLAIDALAVSRVLGVSAAQALPQASFASRFALQGVVAGSPGGGAALIAVDGKPARAYRVGNAIEDGLMLQSANGRQVTLAASREGAALVTLDMPLLSK